MNSMEQVLEQGQSVWIDYIQRGMINRGELKELVEQGLRGLTSNPTIFGKAISETGDYDDAIRRLLKESPHLDSKALVEHLMVEDIRMAADILRPVYESSQGNDGYVSLEVSPHLAHKTEETVGEVRRLWKLVDRPNLMVKVPATPAGIPAIELLISEGININITLMFSLAHYEAVALAYIRGLQGCADPSRAASVASVFVSRIDTEVDTALERISTPEALALRGRAAIANCKLIYRRFQEIFYGEDFASLKERGARVQRPLWGSTSTKNPEYYDVMYVEELIGQDTVNTVPPGTLKALMDHGRVRPSLTAGWDQAERALEGLENLGIDLTAVTEKLQKDGVKAFADSYDALLAATEKKRQVIPVG